MASDEEESPGGDGRCVITVGCSSAITAGGPGGGAASGAAIPLALRERVRVRASADGVRRWQEKLRTVSA